MSELIEPAVLSSCGAQLLDGSCQLTCQCPQQELIVQRKSFGLLLSALMTLRPVLNLMGTQSSEECLININII
jgi:hypothetical protein